MLQKIKIISERYHGNSFTYIKNIIYVVQQNIFVMLCTFSICRVCPIAIGFKVIKINLLQIYVHWGITFKIQSSCIITPLLAYCLVFIRLLEVKLIVLKWYPFRLLLIQMIEKWTKGSIFRTLKNTSSEHNFVLVSLTDHIKRLRSRYFQLKAKFNGTLLLGDSMHQCSRCKHHTHFYPGAIYTLWRLRDNRNCYLN